MQSVTIVRESPVVKSARVLQMCGMFDLENQTHARESWTVDLPLPETWNVGLIVGPSGCGKSTIARELWPQNMVAGWSWDATRSVIDAFPAGMKIADISALLSSVGFSSPPSWLKPFHVLSTGEQFRVEMARTLAEMTELAVVDEFTSVIDRTVAKIGSAAIAKTVRRRNQKLIAVTCHYDVAEWLCPDWIYEPTVNRLARGCLQRPEIKLTIKRVHTDAWELFKRHHYLNDQIHKAAKCFCAFWDGTPVAFTSVLHFPHPKSRNMKRGHRTVCLPDFQGVGIGNALSAHIASMCKGLGARYVSITSNPSMIASRGRSQDWRCIAAPNCKTKTFPYSTSGIKSVSSQSGGYAMRMRATYEYVGKPMDATQARELWGS
jgi:ABC-type nitrate/sulfonate/bicarbonate transport system ATPase subunit